ncbi:MAG: DUF5695 domain-containing protein [Armatimonadetes bacterium]|nr:DUF5695 domain-containing protein [Armatimonadota bacterium]
MENNTCLNSAEFDLKLDNGAVVGLRRVEDSFDTQYILPGKRLGDVILRYRQGAGEWVQTDTGVLAGSGQLTPITSCCGSQYGAKYNIDDRLNLVSRFDLQGGYLNWIIAISNNSDQPIEIGDLALPFEMNTVFAWNKPATESVFKHSFISGYCSYMFWMRPNSVGPYLAMTTFDNTKLEFYDAFRSNTGEGSFKAYVHSAAEGAIAKEKGCNWRQPNTSLILAPKGSNGDAATYGFKFQWAADYDAVRQVYVDEGKIDIQVVPGMTIPSNLFAKFSLRTKQKINSLELEFPEDSEIEYLGTADELTQLFQVKFKKLGENLITVNYGDGCYMFLEFFVTEPIETLIKKRGAFIKKCRHKDPSKWYNGLISEWNMETQVLLGPDNYDKIKGWRIYEVTCDDPGLCKPSFLAAKNAEYPVQDEVDALDYYIENFVWGGLQRTTEEEYSYGIYGIPDWKTLRDSADPGAKGQTHIWRIYDYPHIALMYFGMYRVAAQFPNIKTKLDKIEYLKRAYGTAVAMFTIPTETRDWSAYKTGLYNELVYLDIIDALEAEGMSVQAYRLRKHWEKKVRYFVNDNPSMFGSEYPFDSTGFESTHAFAKYAKAHAVVPDTEEGNKKDIILPEAADKFMEMQTACNIFCRGWLEPSYFLLGSDYRGCGNTAYLLSYMAQMGGWSLLDYALYHTADPFPYLRLAYASYLSSWALMNSGTPESNYGYWYPGAENDGGAGGGFEPAPYCHTWLEQPCSRGSWYYSCEIDLGFSGALRAAATVLADDPLFGMFCYGGDFEKIIGGINIHPKDGLRRRFHAVMANQRLHIELASDHFDSEAPIYLADNFSEIRFCIENEGGHSHETKLRLSGMKAGKYVVCVEESTKECYNVTDQGDLQISLPLASKKQVACVAIKRAI